MIMRYVSVDKNQQSNQEEDKKKCVNDSERRAAHEKCQFSTLSTVFSTIFSIYVLYV